MPRARIRLLIPYYGPWPTVFPLFLASCRRNPNLEVLFFTDNVLPPNSPANVSSVALSFADVTALAARKLGVAIPEGMRPYKLCDYRPAFAVIFEDYLADATFWGHADIDQIFGNTSAFVTPDRLATHDVLTFRPDWVHGPFTIYRNTSAVNRLFEASLEYRSYFERKAYVNFDECLGAHAQLEAGADVLSLHPRPVCMTGLVWAAARDGRIRLHTEMAIVEKLPGGQVLRYRHGGWEDARAKSYVLYHLFREKRLRCFVYPSWTDLPDDFYVTETGFYSAAEIRRHLPLSAIRRVGGAAKAVAALGGRVKRRLTRQLGPGRFK